MTEGSFQQPEIASEPMKNLKCAVLMTCHDRPYHTIPAVLNVIAALERSRFIPLVFLIDSSEGSETIDGLASVRRATLRYRRRQWHQPLVRVRQSAQGGGVECRANRGSPGQ